MGWTNWPPVSGGDIQSWDFIKQAYEALRERAWATGQRHWPRTNLYWASGTVTAMTGTTLTDSSADFGGTGKWPFNYDTTGIVNWDVIIDGDNPDPRKVVRAQVSSWTSTALTIGSIADFVAEGVIASAASLVGKTYYLIKRDGLWWNQRWMDWPNDEDDHGAATSATTSTLTEAGRKWETDQWAGYELVTHTVADGAQRVEIVSNTADTLTFAAQTWTPTGTYSIVPVGGIAVLGRKPGAIYKWYGGATRTLYSHYPDGSLSPTALPALTVRYSSGTGAATCEDTTFDVFDIDWWSGGDEECSTKDKSYSPYLFQTIRGLQLAAENFAGSFIDPDRTYDGSSGVIRNLTQAEWFGLAGINPVSLPYFNSSEASQIIFYTTIKPDGSVRQSGAKTVAAGATVALSDVGYVSGDSTKASKGWTRKMPREFRLMYDKTVFIPDTDETGMIDPPLDDEIGAGSWLTRPKSTTYKDHDAYGLVVDGGVAFVEGEVARYAGDNWNDGNVGSTSFTDNDPLMPYWDRQTEAMPADGVDTSERSGTATGGAQWYLEDTDQDWQGGTLYIHSGTATGGSSSTLADTSKSASWMWTHGPERGRFVGFVLEILSGSFMGLRVPITGYNPATQTLSFAAVAGFNPTGVDYRIREPAYELNRWKGSILRVTKEDGSTADIEITHNDDTRLYFSAQGFAITAGMAYQIIRHSPGGCWMRSGGAWVQPSGNDSRTDTPWPDDQTTLLPTIVTRYGRLMKGDYIQPTLFSELYAGINKLIWTTQTSSWTSRADAGTPENNGYHAETPGTWSTGANIQAAFNAALSDAYTGDWHTDTENDGIAPQASISGSGDTSASPAKAHALISGYYAYGKVAGIPTYLTCSVDWLAYAQINTSDSDENQFCNVIAGPPPDINTSLLFASGGSPAQFRKWAVYDSTGSSADANRQSDKFNVDLPTAGNTSFTQQCGAGGFLWTINQGFIVTEQTCILKWDMSFTG